MRNGISTGEVIRVTAPYAVTAGQGVQVGRLFGVAASDAANGAEVEISTKGVFELTALGTDTATVGQALYWDNTNRRITTTLTSNLLVGCATVAKGSGPTTAVVFVDGTVRP